MSSVAAVDERKSKLKKWFTYIESCEKADEVAKAHGNKPVHTWSCARDMVVYLKPLMKDDESQPKGKPNIISKVHEWVGCLRLTIDADIMEEYQKYKMQKMASTAGCEDESASEVKDLGEETVGIKQIRV